LHPKDIVSWITGDVSINKFSFFCTHYKLNPTKSRLFWSSVQYTGRPQETHYSVVLSELQVSVLNFKGGCYF